MTGRFLQCPPLVIVLIENLHANIKISKHLEHPKRKMMESNIHIFIGA